MEKRMYVGGDAGRTLEEFIGDGRMCGRYVMRILRNKVFIYRLEHLGERIAWNSDDLERFDAYQEIASWHFPWDDVVDYKLTEYFEKDRMTDDEYRELEQEWFKAQQQFRANRAMLIQEM